MRERRTNVVRHMLSLYSRNEALWDEWSRRHLSLCWVKRKEKKGNANEFIRKSLPVVLARIRSNWSGLGRNSERKGQAENSQMSELVAWVSLWKPCASAFFSLIQLAQSFLINTRTLYDIDRISTLAPRCVAFPPISSSLADAQNARPI